MLDVIRQNFKNLVLTAPGERMMIPDFGVGMRNYLFEMNDPLTHSAIRGRLSSQVNKYMSFISILNLEFNDNGADLGDFSNSLQIVITYQILPLGLSDTLLVEI